MTSPAWKARKRSRPRISEARILSPAELLSRTDIAEPALEKLRESRIREVVVLGRRSHLNAAFANAELEELAHLTDVDIVVDPADLAQATEHLASASGPVRRKHAALTGFADGERGGASRRIVLRFLSSPLELLGTDRVEAMRIGRNHASFDEAGSERAVPTGVDEVLSTGLVLRSIGYRGAPIPGLPFDDAKGVVPNQDGRVTERAGTYVAGWIKRGPTGIIGTNKKCARDTVRSLLHDADAAGFRQRERSIGLRSRRESTSPARTSSISTVGGPLMATNGKRAQPPAVLAPSSPRFPRCSTQRSLRAAAPGAPSGTTSSWSAPASAV